MVASTKPSDATEVLVRAKQLPTWQRRSRPNFGLVFEEHEPEVASLPSFPVKPGQLVQFRSRPKLGTYRVRSVRGRQADVEPEGGGATERADLKELLAIRRFGDPIYPVLTPLGGVRRGKDRAAHAVINGENFHTLQLLAYLHAGEVDCIYIDPPYNTGAKDWKYNNSYVDGMDAWRHSKWLSMMEKRLTLARRLLKPDGVLIVTIDEHEVHHLGMLLERLFPDYLRYMVTIVMNPKGRDKLNFAPVGEYAFFVVPNTDDDLIARAPGGAMGVPRTTDDDRGEEDPSDDDEEIGEDDDSEEDALANDEGAADVSEAEPDEDDQWEYRHARRRGGGAEMSSYREKRPDQFYPIYIDEEGRKVVRAGDAIPLGKDPSFRRVGGLRPIWPIDKKGDHRVWAFIPSSMQEKIDAGNVLLGKYHKDRDDWTINYRVPKKNTRKLKTVWWEKSHDAGTHGTELLKKLLGARGLFPFPKSVYAVRDCLAAVVRNRPDALILDFFAGSGTTLHATALLNAADGGERRCILVTNNEVDEKTSKKLAKQGHYRGDPEFETHGIFEQVTRPRCEATIKGRRSDGTEVPGVHVDTAGTRWRPLSDGFDENVEFFKLEYVDPDQVELGAQFDAIHPTLWLGAGACGELTDSAPRTSPIVVAAGGSYAVLRREAKFAELRQRISKLPKLTHVFLVTDSEEAFAEMRSELPADLKVSMLYRDYLRNFKINTARNL